MIQARAVLATALLALLATGVPARGQDAGQDEQSGAKLARLPGGEYRPELEEYTVAKGDTLWDICARYTGSPWHWPQVWSYNPEITNPNWIYPGDLIRFHPSMQELPSMAELISGQREIPEQPPPEVAQEAQPARKRVQLIETAPRPPPSLRTRRFLGRFVTARELAEAGFLSNAVPDKILLAPGDNVFLTFPDEKDGKMGQRYMVYRTARKIIHPITGALWGYMTEVTGFARTTQVTGDVSRAVLTDAVEEIERGQLVTPLVQVPFVQLIKKPATVALDGYVIAVEDGGNIGEDQLAFIDIGKSAGLDYGNELSVFVQPDPLREAKVHLPLVEIARMLVVDVRDTAATCVVTDARQEIRPGMPVRTIVGTPPQASAR